MFDIHGDEICFDGQRIGELRVAPGTLRQRVCDAIATYSAELEYTQAQYDENGDEEYRKGQTAGVDEAIRTARAMRAALGNIAKDYVDGVRLDKSSKATVMKILAQWDSFVSANDV